MTATDQVGYTTPVATYSIIVNPAVTFSPAPAALAAATAGRGLRAHDYRHGRHPGAGLYSSVTVTNFVPGSTGLTLGNLLTNNAGTVTISGTPGTRARPASA